MFAHIRHVLIAESLEIDGFHRIIILYNNSFVNKAVLIKNNIIYNALIIT